MAFKVLPDADYSQVITDADMSSNIVSAAFNLRDRRNSCIQMNWTGNPVGPFAVQVSVNHIQDTEGNVQVMGTFEDLPLDNNISANGVADDAYIELDGLSAPYIRVIYAAVSGSGSINAFISAKAT